jgi:hypothetical protein
MSVLRCAGHYMSMSQSKQKRKFSDYTATDNGSRHVEESLDELRREIDVRRRLYDRWVAEGRLSWTDAHDRLERMLSALAHLLAAPVQPDTSDLDSQEEGA